MKKNQKHTIRTSTAASSSVVSSDVQQVPIAQQAIQAAMTGFTDLVTLDPASRSSLGKPRYRWQQGVGFMVEVMNNHPELVPPRLDSQEMESAAPRVAALKLLEATLVGELQKVKDTILAVGSEAWLSASVVYANAKAAGSTDPALNALIVQFEAIVARKSKAAKPPATPPATTEASTPPGAPATAPAAPATAPAGPASAPGTPASTTGTPAGPTPSGTTSTGVPVYTPAGK